jgi:hypothetical protein
MRVASLCAAGLSLVLLTMPRDILHAQTTTQLRPAVSFESIPDPSARSRALFSEISKVLMNPRCMNCHPVGDRPTQGIPGHPRWDVAPPEMAWQGKSVSEICRQLKDPQRNGGRSLELLHEHLAKDDLVAWGWHPGEGREPAPGSQQELGQLVRSWIDTGAACP